MLPGYPGGANLYKELRLKKFINNILPNYDIVCCQETFGMLNDRKENLIYYAQLAGFPYHAKNPQAQMFGS